MNRLGRTSGRFRRRSTNITPLSFDEWEEGFRGDTTPQREIALWSHAADIYIAFALSEQSAERRKDIYRCIVACLTTGRDTVWLVVRTQALSHAEAEQVVNRFFGTGTAPEDKATQ